MRLLIAYDGSACADAAIDDLAAAGLPSETEARILSVADVFLPPLRAADESPQAVIADRIVGRARGRAAHALEVAAQLAETARGRIQAQFPHWKVSAEASAGSPAWSIIKKAGDWNVDLVAVGSQGHGRLARVMLGSVSEKVFHEAPCSVRIGRPRRDRAAPLRFIVGVDGSAQSAAAVAWAAARSWPANTEARIVTVLDLKIATLLSALDPIATVWVAQDDDDETAWVRRMAESEAKTLRNAEVAASAVVLEGDPRKMLLEEAERWRADCIFVGANGLGALERLFIGTVSSAVATRAHCSVEVVRSPSGLV